MFTLSSSVAILNLSAYGLIDRPDAASLGGLGANASSFEGLKKTKRLIIYWISHLFKSGDNLEELTCLAVNQSPETWKELCVMQNETRAAGSSTRQSVFYYILGNLIKCWVSPGSTPALLVADDLHFSVQQGQPTLQDGWITPKAHLAGSQIPPLPCACTCTLFYRQCPY